MMGDKNNNNMDTMIKQQQQDYYYYSFDGDHHQQQQEMIDLPPGFRFHPTDEELISHYLSPKLRDINFDPLAVAEVDLNKVEPWDLPKKAKMGEKEWYFFCVRDRKYPTGMRTNRATESGYWKATGKDKEIYSKSKSKSLVGMKKTLVFYTGRAPRGHKSGWVMHEYRSEEHSSSSSSDHPNPSKNDWVLCRIFNKDWNAKKMQMIVPEQVMAAEQDFTPSYLDGGDQHLHHQQTSFLPPLTDSSPMTTTTTGYRTCDEDVLSGLNPSSNVTCCISDEDDDAGNYRHKQQQQTATAGSNSYMTGNPSLFAGAGAGEYDHYHTTTGDLLYTDPLYGQDHSILRLLMDGDSGAGMSLTGRGAEQATTTTTTSAPFPSGSGGGDYGSSYNNHYKNNNSISHDYGPIDINCFLNY